MNKSLTALLLIFVTVLLTSCLKTRDQAGLIGDGGSIVVDIPEVSFNHYHGSDQIIAVSTAPSNETVEFFTLAAYYPRGKKPSSDIKVKLTVKPLAGTTPFPAGSLTVPAEIVLPKDNPKVAVKVALNKAGLSLTDTYGATFTITQVSEGVISELGKEIDVYLNVKNQYDGIYTGKGYTLRAGDPDKTGYFKNWSLPLITAGANSVDFGVLQIWADYTGVGIGAPRLTVDPATNLVTVTSSGGAVNTPGYTSRYDPATKTFYVGFHWGAGPASRLAIDTLVYSRPR